MDPDIVYQPSFCRDRVVSRFDVETEQVSIPVVPLEVAAILMRSGNGTGNRAAVFPETSDGKAGGVEVGYTNLGRSGVPFKVFEGRMQTKFLLKGVKVLT